jgi:hypothetical protein
MHEFTHTINGRTYRVLAMNKASAYNGIVALHRAFLLKLAGKDTKRQVQARTWNRLFVPTKIEHKVGDTMPTIGNAVLV